MSQLARAFTTIGKRARKNTSDDNNTPSSPAPFLGRAASQRAGRPVNLVDISSPMALVSTSNMQVHNAKHIAGTNLIEIQHVGNGTASSSSSNASISGDESDNMTVLSGRDDSGTFTDASSVDESPMRSEPEPNHLSCYFKPSVNTATSLQRSRSSTVSSSSPIASPALSCVSEFETWTPSSSSSGDNTPRLPQRVPSHSKRAHERVHRTRSLQRIISPPPRSLNRSSSTRSSFTGNQESSFVEAPRESVTAPFGNELAHLDEVAEEFGMVMLKAEADADAAFLAEKGFAVLGAEVYCAEIAALVEETFGCVYTQDSTWF